MPNESCGARPSFSGKKLGKYLLTLFECVAHPSRYEKSVGKAAHWSKSNLIMDQIADQRAIHPVAGFWEELVTVMPLPEKTSLLQIGKVMVPFEFGDAGNPLHAHWQEAEWTKRSHDQRADAGRPWRPNRIWRGWRRNEMKLVKPCAHRSRHDPRQVFRIGEEGKDPRQRERNPVVELELSAQGGLAQA